MHHAPRSSSVRGPVLGSKDGSEHLTRFSQLDEASSATSLSATWMLELGFCLGGRPLPYGVTRSRAVVPLERSAVTLTECPEHAPARGETRYAR